MGNLQVVLRCYAWVMSLGADGLRQVAETAVLNNSYLKTKFDQVRGLALPYAPEVRRLDQARYSWEGLKRDTGVGTADVDRRVCDFGVNSYFKSHEPWIVPEPFTPEPTETYSKADLDEYAAIIRRVSDEAYTDPDLVRSAPHRSTLPQVDESPLHDIEQVVTTWRAWKRRE